MSVDLDSWKEISSIISVITLLLLFCCGTNRCWRWMKKSEICRCYTNTSGKESAGAENIRTRTTSSTEPEKEAKPKLIISGNTENNQTQIVDLHLNTKQESGDTDIEVIELEKECLPKSGHTENGQTQTVDSPLNIDIEAIEPKSGDTENGQTQTMNLPLKTKIEPPKSWCRKCCCDVEIVFGQLPVKDIVVLAIIGVLELIFVLDERVLLATKKTQTEEEKVDAWLWGCTALQMEVVLCMFVYFVFILFYDLFFFFFVSVCFFQICL